MRYDTALERVRGVAVLLEMASADDVEGVKRAVADHDLSLLHVDCVNASGTSALHAAAANGCSAVIEYLVTEVCVNVNATDNWGRTPLDEATRAAHHETARCLVAAGGRRGLADQLDEQDEPMARISAPNSPRHSLTFDPQLAMSRVTACEAETSSARSPQTTRLRRGRRPDRYPPAARCNRRSCSCSGKTVSGTSGAR